MYCGRAGKGQSGYFGNPFTLKNSGTRNEAIAKFKQYFYERIGHDNEYKHKVLELKGKRLGCFCKPQSCHCDVFVEYLENQLS